MQAISRESITELYLKSKPTASYVEVMDFCEKAEMIAEFRALIHKVLKYGGLSVGLEYMPGDIRFKGKGHERKLRNGYGHIRGYVGNDGEALDCYVKKSVIEEGSNPPTEGGSMIHVVKQVKRDGSFDEEKVMLGWNSLEEAKAGYLAEMPESFLGDIEGVDISALERYKRAGKEVKEPTRDEDEDELADNSESPVVKFPPNFFDIFFGELLEYANSNGIALDKTVQTAESKPAPALDQPSGDNENLRKSVALALVKSAYTDPITQFDIKEQTEPDEVTGTFQDRRVVKGQAGERVCAWRIYREGGQFFVSYKITSDTIQNFEEDSDFSESRIVEEGDYIAELTAAANGLFEACNSDVCIEDTNEYAHVQFAGNTKKTKNCVKGLACGYSCINTSRECQKPLDGQYKKHSEWLLSQGKAKDQNGKEDTEKKSQETKAQEEKAKNEAAKKSEEEQQQQELARAKAEAEKAEAEARKVEAENRKAKAEEERAAAAKEVKPKDASSELQFVTPPAKQRDINKLEKEVLKVEAEGKKLFDSDKATYGDNYGILVSTRIDMSMDSNRFRALKDGNGVIQGMASVVEKPGSIHIEYLATSPWNVKPGDKRYTRGVGSKMMEQVVLESATKGKGGHRDARRSAWCGWLL